MRAEHLARTWAALLWAVALLTGGCVTLTPRAGGSDAQGPRAISVLKATVAGTHPVQPPPAVPPTGSGEQERLSSSEPGEQERLYRRRRGRGLGLDGAMERTDEASPSAVASGGSAPQGPPSCGGQAVPEGWPDDASVSSEERLAPFLRCASPEEFLALQARVDMPRLVEALEDWEAVRLGALGPLGAQASEVLTRKRASFLLTAAEDYGAYAEVFALFIVHTAFDDELPPLLRRLSADKQLGQVLGPMGAVREELARRGIRLSDSPDREEQPGDVVRGLGRAARDALNSSPGRDGARFTGMWNRSRQLPPAYQQAVDERVGALAREHFAPKSVALGSFDSMTFGVPLGFYHLVAGTAHGAGKLAQGHYEQATRELAPASLMVALYAGGKGVRSLPEARRAAGAAWEGVTLHAAELRLRGLKAVAERLRARLGEEGVGQLARYIQARREAAALVGAGGEPAAVALYEARGDVARAQAWLSQARPEPRGPPRPTAGADNRPERATAPPEPPAGSAPKRAGVGSTPGGLASLVDDSAGLSREVVEAKLALAELESPGPRLPRDVAVLEKQRPALDAPPPGAEGNPRWREYVAYYEKRLGEFNQGMAIKAPLRWAPYERMWGWFARGLGFERVMVELLRADAQLPRAQRRWLADFDKPRVETYVGVRKPGTGLRFADVLIIEEGQLGGRLPRVETLSFKSRDLSLLEGKALTAQMTEDMREALRKYGETLDIRRDSLQPILRQRSEVRVSRVRLIYEGGALKPTHARELAEALDAARNEVPGVEVAIQ